MNIQNVDLKNKFTFLKSKRICY